MRPSWNRTAYLTRRWTLAAKRARRRGPTGGSARRLAGNAPTTADVAVASRPSTRRRRCSPSLSARSNMRPPKCGSSLRLLRLRRTDNGERAHGCSNADSRELGARQPPVDDEQPTPPPEPDEFAEIDMLAERRGNNATTVQGRSGGRPPPSTHWRRSRAPGAKAPELGSQRPTCGVQGPTSWCPAQLSLVLATGAGSAASREADEFDEADD